MLILGRLTFNLLQGQAVVATDTTDASGVYYIADVTAGVYVGEVRDVSGKVLASRSITVLADQGTNFINFEISDFNPTESAVFVTSKPAGVAFTVDGGSTIYTTPKSFQWKVGSTHTIQVPTTLPPDPARGISEQQTFIGWSDAETSNTHVVTPERFGVSLEPKYKPTSEFNQYARTQITTEPSITSGPP
jgi:hypothetical protein